MRISDWSSDVCSSDRERLAIAPSLTIRPDSDTTLTLLGGFQRDPDGGLFNPVPSSGTLFSNPNGRLGPDQYFGDPGTDHLSRTQYWLGYQFDHRFNAPWRVSLNLRYLPLSEDRRLGKECVITCYIRCSPDH